jgi:hypothetical protein
MSVPRPVAFEDGACVKFVGLSVRNDLNDKAGVIEGWLSSRGRFDVKIAEGETVGELVAVKQINLVALPEPSVTKVESPVRAKGAAREDQEPAGETKKKEQLQPRPKGRSPAGKVWDPVEGKWNAIKEAAGDDVDSQATDEEEKEEESERESKKPKHGRLSSLGLLGKAALPANGEEEGKNHVRPKGRPPNGKIWNSLSGEWDIDPCSPAEDKRTKQPEGTKQPKGRPKKGCIWNSTSGEWVIDPSFTGEFSKNMTKSLSTDKFPRPRGRPPVGKTWNGQTAKWEDWVTAEKRKRDAEAKGSTKKSVPMID